MKELLKNWDFGRIFRLMVGLAAIIYALTSKEYVFLLLAALFLFQAIFNISCCCADGGCSTTGQDYPKQVYKDIIKPYKPEKK